jgi:hypothetical protein
LESLCMLDLILPLTTPLVSHILALMCPLPVMGADV